MANIANFEVAGATYAYDTEARNPLSDQTKVKAVAGELVYDINTKAPTEVVGVPANKLKTVEEDEDPAENPAEDPVEDPSDPADDNN